MDWISNDNLVRGTKCSVGREEEVKIKTTIFLLSKYHLIFLFAFSFMAGERLKLRLTYFIGLLKTKCVLSLCVRVTGRGVVVLMYCALCVDVCSVRENSI